MLDQNTDRMWYVIGAVIIGAAIIFIMNSTFPQLFASIGETFGDKAKKTTEIVDGIGPAHHEYGPNLIVDGRFEKKAENSANTQYYGDGTPTEVYIYYNLQDVLDSKTTYTLTFDYKTSDNLYSTEAFFLGNTPQSTRTVPSLTGNEWSTWSYTFTTHDPVADPLSKWYTGKLIRFDNNYSKDDKIATLWVKNVQVREKLEVN